MGINKIVIYTLPTEDVRNINREELKEFQKPFGDNLRIIDKKDGGLAVIPTIHLPESDRKIVMEVLIHAGFQKERVDPDQL